MTTVINIKDAPPGWQDDPKFVYIGRAGKGMAGPWGNPFRVTGPNRSEALEKYRGFIIGRLAFDWRFVGAFHRLEGKTLVCYCKPLKCHGDIMIEYLEEFPRAVTVQG